MRVLLISKACVVGAYQRKLEEIATHPDLELTVVVPPRWGALVLERAYERGYTLHVEPVAFNGHFHLHFYPRLGAVLQRWRPEVVHIEEEPYDFVTWHALRLAQRCNARALFFSWQNIPRRYPFPFSYFEQYTLRQASAGIVGNQESLNIWRAKGFTKPLHLIPQFGVDPDIFTPPSTRPARPFTVGYAGRLVPEKGVDVLLQAVAQLPQEVHVQIAGTGSEQGRLKKLTAQLGLSARVIFRATLPSTQMPTFLAGLDAFVLPSRTQSNWKEQFGRVLIEAMACGVPVIGSECGEIPNVIGDAGLIFPEGDVAALSAHLQKLLGDTELRRTLSAAGRLRVLEHYTQKQVAEETVEVYRSLVG